MTARDDASVVRAEREADVLVVTLDRPERLNAFTARGYEELAARLEGAARDDGVAVVVLTGAGPAFSSGVDVDVLRSADRAGIAALERGFERLVDALVDLPQPLVAAVRGYAVGIGLTMLLHCDFVVAGADARFRAPFAELGVAPEAGSSGLLPARIGMQRAAWMLFTGGWLDAHAARDAGLVWDVVEPDRVLPDALALAHDLARSSAGWLRATKRLLTAARRDMIVAARAAERTATPMPTSPERSPSVAPARE